MITYILKSGLCLALLLFVYKLLLERERMYTFNRYYLLIGLCFAFIVPLMTMEISAEIPVAEDATVVNFEDSNFDKTVLLAKETAKITTGIPAWVFILVSIYAVGYLVFFVRFMNNIYQIFYKITRNVKAFYKKASLVLLKENTLPHTFLHYIFIEKEAYETKNIAEELYTHELAHVTQKHTLDILLIELIQIVFWFNPLLIYYKKAIQLNHEFLADDAVLKSNTQIPAYQQLLLDNASWNHNSYLVSNLNFSVTKKRLEMMTKHTSKIRTWLFATLTIPVFIGAFLLFSTKVAAKETAAEIIEVPTTIIETETQQDPKAAYYQYATFIFEDENGNKTTKTFAELTKEEKALLMPVPTKPIAKRPNSTLLADWQNKEKFAIWVDGKVIDNKDIANYTIVHYTGSYVHNNARSKRFPQPYQMHLYTAAGFEGLNKELQNPLSKSAVLHFKKGKNGKMMSKKVGNVMTKPTAREQLAETNKFPYYLKDQNSGPNASEFPELKKEDPYNSGRKDIVILINKNGDFLVNYEYSSNLKNLKKTIKQELFKVRHKKARTALIIYDAYEKSELKQAIENAQKVLQDLNITDIGIMSSADIPPPPPPAPAPPKPKKAPKAIKVKKKEKASKQAKPIIIEVIEEEPQQKRPKIIEVREVTEKEERPEIIEVKETVNNTVTEEQARAISIMHRIIKGQELKTMMINGKKHYYVIKKGREFIFNEDSKLVDKNGKELPPPPPPPPSKKKVGKTKASKKVINEWKDVAYFLDKETKQKNGVIEINGENFYYATKDGKKLLYNRFGEAVDKDGNVIKRSSKIKEKV